MRLKIIVSEPWELADGPLEATIVSAGTAPDAPSVLSVLLKLDWPVTDRGRSYGYLVARPRADRGLDQVATGSTVEAVLTGIPYDRVSQQPLDLNGWRGGLGMVGSVSQIAAPIGSSKISTEYFLSSKALALEWSPASVRLLGLPHGETVATLAVPEAVGTARIDLALFAGAEMGLVLRVPSATREPFVRVVGDKLEPVPRVPGEGYLSTTDCRAHAGGLLTAIDGAAVWVLGRASSTWSARALPAGIVARDVSFAPDGSLWVAGRTLRAGAPPAAVLLRLTEQGHEVVALPLSAKDRRRLDKRGADEDYWRVDMEGTPGLLFASSPWFEDSTEFVIIGWDAGWSVVTVHEEAIWPWVRDGGLTLYSGTRRLLVAGQGERHGVEDLRPAIRAAWPGGAPPRDPIIRAARARGHELLLAVRVLDWREPPPRHIKANAIFHSTDDGRSFQPWAHTAGSGSELLDVVWL